ncbi:nitrate/nitrite sensor protein NarQ [compost metagenome]
MDDNGKGFAATEQQLDTDDTRHLGLATMQERASLLGGRLTCVSAINCGTQLHVGVPVNLDGTSQ